MSVFYDEASLVVVPSGYKSGKIYAQKPLTTDGQLTFTRASTATRVNASGLIESVASGVPRLDYTNSSCPKLLLEPQRTNLVTYSEQFDNAAWDNGGLTATANDTVSPDGYTNADKLTETATSGNHLFYNLNPISGAATSTVSVFYKKGTRRYFAIKLQIGSNSHTQVFDADMAAATSNSSNGLTGVSTSIVSYGNGWVRASVTGTDPAASTTCYAIISLSNAATPTFDPATYNPSYTGSTSENGYFYGAQLEAGVYASSYVKTEAAAVTRLADQVSKTGISSLIGQTEGTFFYDFVFSRGMASFGYVSLENAAASDRIRSLYVASSNTLAFDFIVSNASLGAIYSFTPVDGTRYKIAWGYKNGDTVIYINGTQVGTSTAAIAYTDLSVISFENPSAATQQIMAGKYNQAILFKTRLSNAKLAELTSL